MDNFHLYQSVYCAKIVLDMGFDLFDLEIYAYRISGGHKIT